MSLSSVWEYLYLFIRLGLKNDCIISLDVCACVYVCELGKIPIELDLDLRRTITGSYCLAPLLSEMHTHKTHLVLIVEILQVLQYKEYTICKHIYFSVKKKISFIYTHGN